MLQVPTRTIIKNKICDRCNKKAVPSKTEKVCEVCAEQIVKRRLKEMGFL
jgi:hypothetical protein